MKSSTVGLSIIALSTIAYVFVELLRSAYYTSQRDKKKTFWSRFICRNSRIPFIAFRVSLEPNLIKKQVKYVCKVLVPDWRHLEDAELRVERVLGGITNRIFCVSVNKDAPNLFFNKVLVRVFGAEGIIDREKENEIFEQLAKNRIAPSFIGEFANGRIESWLQARCISIEEMRYPNISKAVAQKLAILHRFQPQGHRKSLQDSPVWESIYAWLKEAKVALKQLENTELDDSRRLLLKQIDLLVLEKELEFLRNTLRKTPSPIVFSHNDLLFGNILYDEISGTVHFVDFEYSGWNYRGFDIGNHFCECMGGTDNGIPDYTKYPTEEQQHLFCQHYLVSYGGFENVSSVNETDIKSLMIEANRYALLSHFYWGMWALCLSVDQTVDFDYLL
ncbi:choline/ethanolamine kinase isoform 2 [Galdieria sulphuraria]|nr:choline/ethanolamine kinase isoform 2 [Galdieria sulphuraria]EME30812.1 choline/ethanolamine kinase isoform 2 [Galdieria sulphuraria]|eukprot:XP_005707332.1 choline/ethanolamine kinase isoform 2 [Galdieria sulphuraria]